MELFKQTREQIRKVRGEMIGKNTLERAKLMEQQWKLVERLEKIAKTREEKIDALVVKYEGRMLEVASWYFRVEEGRAIITELKQVIADLEGLK